MICNNCHLKVTLLAALTGLIIKNKTANPPERKLKRLRQFEQAEIRLICTGLPSLTTSRHFTAVFVSGFSFDKNIKNTARRRNAMMGQLHCLVLIGLGCFICSCIKAFL